MTDTHITVRYSRRLGDGNFGSEECSLEWSGAHDQAYGDVASALRVQVLAFLASSSAERVMYEARRELNLNASHAAIPPQVAAAF